MKQMSYTLIVKEGIFQKTIYKYILKEDAITDAVKFLREGKEVRIK